jgi:hypothetical protein
VSGFRKVLLAKGCLPFFSQYSSFLKYTYNDDMVLAALELSATKKPVPLCNAEAGVIRWYSKASRLLHHESRSFLFSRLLSCTSAFPLTTYKPLYFSLHHHTSEVFLPKLTRTGSFLPLFLPASSVDSIENSTRQPITVPARPVALRSDTDVLLSEGLKPLRLLFYSLFQIHSFKRYRRNEHVCLSPKSLTSYLRVCISSPFFLTQKRARSKLMICSRLWESKALNEIRMFGIREGSAQILQ